MKKQKKLLGWIYGLCFVIVWLFPGKALSQTNWPKEVCQIGYNMETLNSPAEYYNRDYKYLPVEFFPWGVCLNGNTTALEDAWTEYAVNKWNEDYIKYKEKVWESAYVVDIPGQLFTISCNDSKYNLIYVSKKDLPKNYWGRYYQQDTIWDFQDFHAYIEMDTRTPHNKPRNFTREHFINVMIHELGHAIAIPHIHPDLTDIMQSDGFGCFEFEENICEFTDTDWEKFLGPYNPEESYKARKEREKKHIEFLHYVNDICKGSVACSADMGMYK